MKKLITMILSLTMVLSLAACGSEKAPDASNESNVDLSAFYNELAEKYNWAGEDPENQEYDPEAVMMMDLTATPELMENYFAGLGEISTKQLIAQTSMISAIVNEYVFVECEKEEDAAKVAEILQGRITMQAEGGAMYPESVEAWTKAQVVTNGAYVAMIASFENQSEIVEAFNALFA